MRYQVVVTFAGEVTSVVVLETISVETIAEKELGTVDYC